MSWTTFCLLLLAPLGEPAAPVDGVDEILARWGAKSSEVRSIKATLTREDVSPLFDQKVAYQGWYSFRDPKTVRLDFFRTVAGKPQQLDERLMIAGDAFYQFKGPTKQVFVFTRPEPDPTRIDLAKGPKDSNAGVLAQLSRFLAMGGLFDLAQPDGPFLFLTIRPDQAKARFRIERRPDRPGQYVLRFTPIVARERNEFSQADILLNATTLLPDAVKLTATNRKDTKTFHYTKIEINVDLPDDQFRPDIPPGWHVVR